MRISDWSSDVCSSDLGVAQPRLEARQEAADVLLAVEPRLEQAAARITEILDELVAKRHPRPIDQIGVRHREPRTAIVIGVEHQFGNAVADRGADVLVLAPRGLIADVEVQDRKSTRLNSSP